MNRDDLFDQGGRNVLPKKLLRFPLAPLSKKLSQGATWWVRTLNSAGQGPWSQNMKFRASSPKGERRIVFLSHVFTFKRAGNESSPVGNKLIRRKQSFPEFNP
jgi:hypothetical protein